jgi:Ca-activated chloride channel family protein
MRPSKPEHDGSPRRTLLKTVFFKAALLCLAPVLAAGSLAAQGWIEPTGGGAVVRLRTSVSVDVTGRIAQVQVEEWFQNRGGRVAEGAYLYPLPGEAVFSGFSLFQDDQELRGETMDADRARRIYEEIVRKRRDPALIELAGHGLIRARVFPIEPGQTRKITLRYTQVLERAGDALLLRYAAGSALPGRVLPPRPMPRPRPRPWFSQPPQPTVPSVDSQRTPTNRTAPNAQAGSDRTPLTFVVRIADGSRFRDPFSPTHDVRVSRERGAITVRPERELSGDFSLFLPLARGLVGMTVAAHRAGDDDGYFMLTLSPGEADAAATPRDITAVVDVSGSMSGDKLDQTRQALHQLLSSLAPADRFRLVAFNNRVERFRSGWSSGDRDAADAWIDGLQAEGGTDIAGALAEAFRLPSPEGRLPIVVFLTDGLPTVGERNPERIAAEAERDRGRARVFAFGVGYDVNTVLLDRLSAAGRGTTAYVEPGQNVETALGSLAAKIQHPVLTDLHIDGAPVELREIYPEQLPDLFAGEDLVLFGRYRAAGNGNGALRITGRRAGRTERFATDASFPAHETANDYIPRLWASRKVGALMQQIRLNGADPELVEEVRRTALRYGILSAYTAHLVQEPNRVAVGGAPAPMSFADAMSQAASAPASGQAAVAEAKAAARSRAVTNSAEMEAEELSFRQGVTTNTRVVAGRAFVQDSAGWRQVDADRSLRVAAVKPFSEAYFDLLQAAPELKPLFAAFEQVVVGGVRANVAGWSGAAEWARDQEAGSRFPWAVNSVHERRLGRGVSIHVPGPGPLPVPQGVGRGPGLGPGAGGVRAGPEPFAGPAARMAVRGGVEPGARRGARRNPPAPAPGAREGRGRRAGCGGQRARPHRRHGARAPCRVGADRVGAVVGAGPGSVAVVAIRSQLRGDRGPDRSGHRCHRHDAGPGPCPAGGGGPRDGAARDGKGRDGRCRT